MERNKNLLRRLCLALILTQTMVACVPRSLKPIQIQASQTANEAGSQSRRAVYRGIGMGSGGYQNIREARWPDHCVKGDFTNTTGSLFPFNEPQTLVLRGPLEISDLVIYEKEPGTYSWTKAYDLGSLKWDEVIFGLRKQLGTYPAMNAVLQNGREIFTQIPNGGEKIILIRAKMPRVTGNLYTTVAQDDVPAIWLLNSKVFQQPSSQYFCNCRGQGGKGGCGELDIAEIIPENRNEVTSTLYSYDGSGGSKFSAPRPTDRFQIYGVALIAAHEGGEISVIETDSFDFTRTKLTDFFVSLEWLPSMNSADIQRTVY